jgi:hypothetical protein
MVNRTVVGQHLFGQGGTLRDQHFLFSPSRHRYLMPVSGLRAGSGVQGLTRVELDDELLASGT